MYQTEIHWDLKSWRLFHSNWGPITNIELIESFLVKVILCQWYVSCADTSYIKWDLLNSYFVTGPWIPPSFNYNQNFPSSYLGWFIFRILHSLSCLYRSENQQLEYVLISHHWPETPVIWSRFMKTKTKNSVSRLFFDCMGLRRG